MIKFKMKKIFIFWLLIILNLFLIKGIYAVGAGAIIANGINISENHPYVFKCGNTSYLDDSTEYGRVSRDHEELIERKYKSLFEGEQIKWKVLVIDLNGVDKIEGVYATLGKNVSIGNNIEVNCQESTGINKILDSCSLYDIKDEIPEFKPEIMKYYDCTLTCETFDTMYGKYWVTVEARDVKGSAGIMQEAENWFFNPIIALSINDSIRFDNPKPGKISYSNEIVIQNSADEGSGVIMDMFISGTNFLSSDENSYCPEKNKLNLNTIKYYAENGAYDTISTLGADNEGYMSIKYGIGFNNPINFYNNYEIIPKNKDPILPDYYLANELNPKDEMKLKFKIDVPSLCKGNFNQGNIFIWGEAI
jgi:hypothetical protein